MNTNISNNQQKKLTIFFMMLQLFLLKTAFAIEKVPFDGSKVRESDLAYQICLNPTIPQALAQVKERFPSETAIYMNCTTFNDLDYRVKNAVSDCSVLATSEATYYWCPICREGFTSDASCRIPMRPTGEEAQCTMCFEMTTTSNAQKIFSTAGLLLGITASLFSLL
jgi:hypothetical protein